MSERFTTRASVLHLLQQYLFPVAILGASVTVLAVSSLVSPSIAIRGLYSVFGLLVGAGVYYFADTSAIRSVSQDRLRWAGKGVFTLSALAIGGTAVLGERLLVLVIVLPIGYTLLFFQFRTERSPTSLIAQIIALFSISPVTKYLTSGFYFGGGDLLFHVDNIQQVLATGTTAGMQYHITYRDFPGLHLLASSVSAITSLEPYDALMTTGIAFYVFAAIPFVYIFFKFLLGKPRYGLYVLFGASLLYPISYHVTYFFPQSLGVVMLLFALFASYRAGDSSEQSHRIWMGLSLYFIASAVFTHHLSFVLLTPVLVVLGAVPILVYMTPKSGSTFPKLQEPRYLPLVAGWFIAVLYWSIQSELFVYTLFFWMNRLITEVLLGAPATGTAGGGTVAFGTTVPEPTLSQAVTNLALPNSLYLTALMAVFVLGLVKILDEYPQFRTSLAVLVLGCLSAGVLFRTPILIPGLNRIRLPFAFFFALPLGIGLYRLRESTKMRSIGRYIPVIIFLVLATTAPLYGEASKDFNRFEAGSQPHPQVAFSEQEYAALSTAARFTNNHNPSVETLWIDELALENLGSATVDSARYSGDRIEATSGLLLYRDTWTRYLTYISNPEWRKVVMSDGWLARNVAQSNKVYTSGPVGLLWEDGSVRLEQTGG